MTTHTAHQKTHWQVVANTLQYHQKPSLKTATEPRHGGTTARQWRQKIALLSTQKPVEKLRTLTFPLADAPEIPFDEATKLYDATEGLGKGTLIGLLCAVHLAGFRVFQNVAEALQYRHQQAQGGRDLARALVAFFAQHYDLNITEQGAQFIQSLATSMPKPPKRGEFSAENLANLLCKRMSSRGLQSQKDATISAFCQKVAADLVTAFADWDVLKGDAVLEWGDAYFRVQHADFPNLLGKTEIPEADSKCIAFDAEKASTLIEISDEHIRDYGLHLVVACCAHELNPTQAIVSFQNNAISWLFGAGLGYLRNATVEQLLADFAIPASRQPAIARLIDYANALPINENGIPLLGKDHYAVFRRSTSGKVTSWATNYLGRLNDLHAFYTDEQTQNILNQFVELHAKLQTNTEAMLLFRGLEEDWLVLAQAQAHYATLREQTLQATERLLAKRTGVSVCDAQTVEASSQLLATWGASMAKLRARIEQVLEDVKNATQLGDNRVLAEALAKQKHTLPKAFPKISGGTADLQAYGAGAAQRLNDLIAAQDYFVQQAQALDTHQVLAQFAAQERQSAQAHSKKAQTFDDAQWQSLAAQRFLQKIANLVKRLEGEAAKQDLRALLQQWAVLCPIKYARQLQTKYNQLLINHKGRLYVSPWSPAHRHDAYAIRQSCWQGATWVEDIVHLMQTLASQLPTLQDTALAHAVRNWLEYRNLLVGWLVVADDGQTSTVTLPNTLHNLAGISQLQQRWLQQASISNHELKRIVNLMQSEIVQLRYGLLRPEVLVRTKFSLTGEKDVFYAIKSERTWQMPARYYQKYPSLHALFEGQTALDSATLLAKAKDILCSADAGALVKQMPHDWYLPWQLISVEQQKRRGFAHHGALQDEFVQPKKMDTASAVLGRLVGSPAHKGALEKILSGEAKTGDLTLLLDFVFKQNLRYAQGFGFSVQQQAIGQKLSLAVPLTEKIGAETLSHRAFFDRCIAFDQGERFISYAVFDVRDYIENGNLNPCVDQAGDALVGKIAIPAVLHLRQKVKQARNKPATQKITDKYNRAMEKRREAAVGEVSQRIERLCQKYRAFPVLESQLDTFEKGGNQIKVIYGSLLHLYAASQVDAHKALRAHHWYGANNWQHPYLFVNKYDYIADEVGGKLRKSGKTKIEPLRVYPATTVHPAYTSKICVFCQRNPIQALDRHFEKTAKITVQADGRCQVEDGDLLIKERNRFGKQDSLMRKARRKDNRNLRGELLRALAAGEYPKDAIQQHARATLRQQALVLNQQDTTQSRYQCLYADCGRTYHADEGAAINIGRKFLQQIHQEKSQEKLKESLALTQAQA